MCPQKARGKITCSYKAQGQIYTVLLLMNRGIQRDRYKVSTTEKVSLEGKINQPYDLE